MSPTTPEKSPSRQIWGLLALVAAIVAAGWYGWSQWAAHQRGIPEVGSEERRMGRPGPPSPEQFAQVLDEIGLTEEQKARILAMPRPEGREGFRQRREQMEQILTPEQMEKMRDMFRSRMRARRAEMGRNLSPKDQAALERRFERRAGEVRGGRGGPGGGPGRGE